MEAIHDSETDSSYDQFFRPEFTGQRLGAPGVWQGGAVARLGLQNPVQAGDMGRLLQGLAPHGPWRVRDMRGQNVEGGWRLTLRATPPLTALWALSPGFLRVGIRLAQRNAVKEAVADFERTLNGRPWFDNPSAPGRKLALFASFQSGASSRQTPQVQTDLFLFNFIIQRGGGFSTFAPEQVRQLTARMEDVYKRTVENKVWWMVGSPLRFPRDLYERLQSPSDFGPQQTDLKAGEKWLGGKRLVAFWRERAERCGWERMKFSRLVSEGADPFHWRNTLRMIAIADRIVAITLRARERKASMTAEHRAKPRVAQRVKPPRIEQPEPVKKVNQHQENAQSHSR